MIAVVSMPDFLLGLAVGFASYSIYQEIKESIKHYGLIQAFKRLWGM